MTRINFPKHNRDWRNRILRNQVTDLIMHEKLILEYERARDLSQLADKLVTLGKKATLASRRQALVWLRPVGGDHQTAVRKLFDVIAPRFKKRDGGYTQVIKTASRAGDNAPMALIKWVDAK